MQSLDVYIHTYIYIYIYDAFPFFPANPRKVSGLGSRIGLKRSDLGPNCRCLGSMEATCLGGLGRLLAQELQFEGLDLIQA